MRYGGEYFFEYKDIYCLLDNDRITSVLQEMKVSPEKQITYFHALPGLHEIEREIQNYLVSMYKKDKDVFVDKYYNNEYYDEYAQNMLIYYLRGYAYKVKKACYNEYFNKDNHRYGLSNIYTRVFNIDSDHYTISLFTVNKFLFYNKIKFNGHIYFSIKDIYRVNGSLTNFFVELKNNVTINFNANYVNVYVSRSNSTNDGV
ncbi:hypothetical protein EHE19_007110 [Ruminiclostridium herbifermentans]|uniref:Uncharacterized protein n=1 Tax=Ruminiclostridium herbifermentans TaxID=2488810 RepID=A0A4U7JK49_9FIRM|nr:hypothetical protein [Ruminiclostridium herbifermentans]QNU68184.1 hypothetical protein EHE19_007110 [Ruminiclostridium herbifermentans]